MHFTRLKFAFAPHHTAHTFRVLLPCAFAVAPLDFFYFYVYQEPYFSLWGPSRSGVEYRAEVVGFIIRFLCSALPPPPLGCTVVSLSDRTRSSFGCGVCARSWVSWRAKTVSTTPNIQHPSNGFTTRTQIRTQAKCWVRSCLRTLPEGRTCTTSEHFFVALFFRSSTALHRATGNYITWTPSLFLAFMLGLLFCMNFIEISTSTLPEQSSLSFRTIRPRSSTNIAPKLRNHPP